MPTSGVTPKGSQIFYQKSEAVCFTTLLFLGVMKGTGSLLKHECIMVALLLNVYPREKQRNGAKMLSNYIQGKERTNTVAFD